MIPQKRHAMPAGSVLIDWLLSSGRAWRHRWTTVAAIEASNDSRPALDEPGALALDIDLALLEALAALRRRHESLPSAESPRREFADGWRTRPNVRFVGPAGVDVPALLRSLADEPRE